jgi:hypothetical protein
MSNEQITKLGDNGMILHTFTLGEILISVLLFIIMIILLINMGNSSNK